MYKTFVTVQEELYDLKDANDNRMIEARLVALHYLLGKMSREEIEDLDAFLVAYSNSYLFLAEEMKKHYIKEEKQDEIFQMSRPTDTVN